MLLVQLGIQNFWLVKKVVDFGKITLSNDALTTPEFELTHHHLKENSR
ncbi:hypothetical protein X949_3506 [Burkholderia pseudomallei MSHR5609]|nr:hypothetical protein DP51_1258 [Burkholderia pseudomallei]EDU09236.1 hypothetical protein BURPS1655_K0568 [Burkholderia pseudomallei 1655]KGC37045.1 hypothetical protein DO62_4613 [Burkholderia pseudomallei]KGS57485.1 hypothetical protein X949_3506 [Burkholderia pseudomallei MSHR5609]